MEFKFKLDEGAFAPELAHSSDAGFDLRTREDVFIPAYESACFDTGVHILIQPGYVGFLKSKSGLNVKYGLTGTGVIDAGYTGSIVVKLYNHTDEAHLFKKGDKISQIIFLKIPHISLELVNDFDLKTDRGDNGFGSTGI